MKITTRVNIKNPITSKDCEIITSMEITDLEENELPEPLDPKIKNLIESCLQAISLILLGPILTPRYAQKIIINLLEKLHETNQSNMQLTELSIPPDQQIH